MTKIIDKKEESKLNKTIKEVTDYFEKMLFNKAIISLMQFTNWLHNKDTLSKESAEKLIIMMCPFTPHTCEELWEKIKNKPFCSLQKWPSYNERKIDEKIDVAEETIHKAIADITNVLKLISIKEPKKITLIVSSEWKYSFFNKLKKELSKTRDIGKIIKTVMDKQHAKEISSLVPRLVKDESKIPSVILDQKTELKQLEEARDFIKKEFKCEIEIIKAENSKDPKANNAMPSKPAIVIE